MSSSISAYLPAAAAAGSRPLANRVVLITGASAGLGAQMAHAVARAGADVVLVARRGDRLRALAEALPQAHPITADVTEPADRRRLVDEAVERFGRLDALVNNAGIGNAGPALRQTTESFERVLELNLVAPFELSCLAAAIMRRNGGGAIVNIASVMATRSIDRLPDAAYVASKAGLIGLTRELASQWGRHGIRVNALAPGFFESEMTAELLTAPGSAPVWLTEGTALGRVGRQGELDEALVLLLGAGGAYITGQTLLVDGGMSTR
jgi:NAD(P)-dependent dehydrogenase (short-subunit alcohol dehydrogenase family)